MAPSEDDFILTLSDNEEEAAEPVCKFPEREFQCRF
jgi:hypothetical protein